MGSKVGCSLVIALNGLERAFAAILLCGRGR
jgi:hypothetical protein